MIKHLGPIAAVVVTYNRFGLLINCLHALVAQTGQLDRVIIVDNASTDGTYEALARAGMLSDPAIEYLRLPENLGGAGGFAAGLASAFASGCDWAWVMDDDAVPEPEALQALLDVQPEPGAIYACAAVDPGDPDRLVWPTRAARGESGNILKRITELPTAVVEVGNAPFIGMLIHRDCIARMGLPDARLFVSGDDAEFCARAWNCGVGVRLVSSAIIRHPPIRRRCLGLFGRWLCVIEVAPWRRYYDTRNRLVVAKRHFGARLWTEALPGTLVRWLVTLIVQPNRLAQSAAFARGILDGLTERLGMRWPPPG